DAYLASAGAKNIEGEDFDIAGVGGIDNPVASGYPYSVTLFNNENAVPFPWPGALNQGSTAYVLQPAVNAHTNAGVGDFYDYDNNNNRVTEADYRPIGSIGTAQGANDFAYFKPGQGQSAWAVFDTQRAKYSAVDPDLQEYNVERTEGG